MSPFLELHGLEMGFNRRENGLNHKNSVVCFLGFFLATEEINELFSNAKIFLFLRPAQ